jgi:hypothetical protein
LTDKRHPEEIRQSIESVRGDLVVSIGSLRHKTDQASDWRGALGRNKQAAVVVACVAGFVVGGGIAALAGFVRSGD